MVRLSGGGGDWFWGESPVGGLNSADEGMQIADFSLSIRGMQGITDRNSLNWLFGVCCIVFTLSSCISRGSGSFSEEVIGVRLKKRESTWIKALRIIEPYGLQRSFQLDHHSLRLRV